MTFETPSPQNPDVLDPLAPHRALLDSVKAREKFFSDGWWKAAEKAEKLFNNEKEDPQNPYNVLYSNTEVLKPSLYSATPKPDVRGRYVENPVSPLTQLVERLLIVFSDPANPGEESFDFAMSDAVTSALVTGLGFIRLRVYPEKSFPLCPESGHFRGLVWAAGRKWSKLPWIAFRHEMTKEEIFSQFKIEGEAKLGYESSTEDDPEEDDKRKHASVVYEIWRRSDRKVLFLCEDWKELLLREDDDPLNLQGFFPSPGPLLMTQKPGRLVPTPLYEYYRNQAEELNRVTYRLNRVLSAIKVRGAYNPLLGDELQRLLADDQSDNALVPAAENAAMMAQTGGFDKHVWMLPIDQLIEVATQLYAARQQIKQVIYEITGLSDIIRGSTVASETATAQNLKNKWGSIRLRDMQRAVAGYVRDLYRMAVDAAVDSVPPDQWKSIAQAPFPLAAEKQAAIQQIQYSVANGMEPSPQILQTAQSPSIEELLSSIRSDVNRAFVINVQSDSTVDIDTATDKQEVAEYMNSMGQLMAGLQPLAALGPSGLSAAKAILIAVSSRFKFGHSIIDSLRALEPPPPIPQGPTPEQEKAQKDLDAREAELEKRETDLQSLLDQLEDAKREIETSRKEFAADIRVQKAEQTAAGAQEQARQVQAESRLQNIVTKAGTPPGNAKPSGKMGAGARQNPAQPSPEPLAAAVATLAAAVSEMQQAMRLLASPRVAQKDPKTGLWASTVVLQ